MSDEIITVPVWEYVWWDKINDCEFLAAVTGTPWNPIPTEHLQRRYIQRVGGRKVHSGCGGAIETKWSTRWEDAKSFTVFWQECLQCRKRMSYGE